MLGIGALLARKPGAALGRPAPARGARPRAGARAAWPSCSTSRSLISTPSSAPRMRTELVKLHRQLGRPSIHVTHDQVEAMTMGERICIMRDGQRGPGRRAARGLPQSSRHLRRRLSRHARR